MGSVFRQAGLLVLGLLCLSPVWGQVTFMVTSVPDDTPPGAELYITGNFNEWDPAMPEYRLQPNADGHWTITLHEQLRDTVRFKFTRGTFASVEGNAYGLLRNERLLVVPARPTTVPVVIESWEDTPSKQNYRIYVDGVPPNTPEDAKLFIVGNFNNWAPSETRYQLRELRDGRFYIQLPFLLDTLQFKFTRGTWNTVEANAAGDVRNNRQHLLVDHPTYEIHCHIEGWEDLEPLRTVHITVTSIPDNTPHDARLFVAGNFNQWTSDDPRYELQRQDNGHYKARVYSASDTLQYKITRGNYGSVEGRSNGLMRSNRVFVIPAQEGEFFLNIGVEAWEDLATRWFNLYTLALMLPLGIGLLLMAGLFWRRPERGWEGPRVVPVLAVISAVLLFRVLYYYREVFNVYPWVVLWADMAYFLVPPVFYSYLHRLVYPNHTGRILARWYWLPAVAHAILILVFHILPKQEFLLRFVNQQDHVLFGVVSVLGWGYGGWLWLRGLHLFRQYRAQMANTLARPVEGQYLPALLSVFGGVYLVWGVINALGVIEFGLGVPLAHWIEMGTNLAWWLTSCPILVVGYYALRAPQLQDPTPEQSATPEREEGLSAEELQMAGQRLRRLMEEEQPYLNPGLTLNDLAQAAHMPDGQLSRVINEALGQNFYDFVNDYRVRAFIGRVQAGQDQHLTFLALALTVGFSSKSTFNRAFKKLTNTTPREFFRLSRDEQERRLQGDAAMVKA